MWYTKKQDLLLLLMRIVFGGLMLALHGWPKLQKILDGNTTSFRDPLGLGPEISLYLAVFAELVCAALIIIGLFTRWAAAPLIFTMLVAIFIVKAGMPLDDREMALLYLIPFVMLFFLGPGRYSIDARLPFKF